MKCFEVIISGAGPVGLFLAAELALRDCSVLVVEKSSETETELKKLPFGIRGLTSPTVEALYRRGLLGDLDIHKALKDPHGQQSKRQVGHFAGIPLYESLVDLSRFKFRLPSSTPAILISEMQELENVLSRRAKNLGVTILRGLELKNFTQTTTDVSVDLSGETYQAKWLVGCDGARSAVRKALGVEFEGTEPEFTGYSFKVDVLDPEKLKPGRILTSRGMYLQSRAGFFNVQEFDHGAAQGIELTLESVEDVLRRVSETDVTLSAFHVGTTWTDRSRQAARYKLGRVFLAGDAAHIHSPLGGQGLNLGLGDAMNLGWKLAGVLKGELSESILETYESERHPVGVKVLDWSRAQVSIMRPEASSRAMFKVFTDLVNTADGANYVAERLWGLNLRYDLGEAHPLVGMSAPNFEFVDGTFLGEHLRDGKGILLDLADHGELEGQASGLMKYLKLQAKQTFGLRSVVLRPDGIVSAVDELS